MLTILDAFFSVKKVAEVLTSSPPEIQASFEPEIQASFELEEPLMSMPKPQEFTIDNFYDEVIEPSEGGWNPNDPSYRGITVAIANKFGGMNIPKDATIEQIREGLQTITKEKAKAITKQMFNDSPAAKIKDPKARLIMFDGMFNSGVHRAAELYMDMYGGKKQFGISDDYKGTYTFGPKILAHINNSKDPVAQSLAFRNYALQHSKGYKKYKAGFDARQKLIERYGKKASIVNQGKEMLSKVQDTGQEMLSKANDTAIDLYKKTEATYNNDIKPQLQSYASEFHNLAFGGHTPMVAPAQAQAQAQASAQATASRESFNRFQKVLAQIEGGWNPNDPSYAGIQWHTYAKYGGKDIPENLSKAQKAKILQGLSKNEVQDISYKLFVDSGASKIKDPRAAHLYFDSVFHSGGGRSAKEMAKLLGGPEKLGLDKGYKGRYKFGDRMASAVNKWKNPVQKMRDFRKHVLETSRAYNSHRVGFDHRMKKLDQYVKQSRPVRDRFFS